MDTNSNNGYKFKQWISTLLKQILTLDIDEKTRADDKNFLRSLSTTGKKMKTKQRKKSNWHTHYGCPGETESIDHMLTIQRVQNRHQYEMRCVDCNKHIKWATELEYAWVNGVRDGSVSFRDLYMATSSDPVYLAIRDELAAERAQEIQKSYSQK